MAAASAPCAWRKQRGMRCSLDALVFSETHHVTRRLSTRPYVWYVLISGHASISGTDGAFGGLAMVEQATQLRAGTSAHKLPKLLLSSNIPRAPRALR